MAETEKDKTPVAGVVVTRCTKCKADTGHVVMAQNRGGLVAKVKCKTCGSEHRYYSDEKRLSAKMNREKAAREANIARNVEEYARLIAHHSSKKVIPYSLNEKYNVDDIIDHKTFGKGAIIKVYSEKMDVLFESGPRLLACNRPVA